MNLSISRATREKIDDVALLFDAYRVFYRQESNYEKVRLFITERLQNQDAVIFLATRNNQPVGYVQLFPSFSSVSLKRVWILNDLFVVEEVRQKGVAKALIKAVEDYAISTNAVRIVLATEVTNTIAQNLYETMGYRKLDEFFYYTLTIS